MSIPLIRLNSTCIILSDFLKQIKKIRGRGSVDIRPFIAGDKEWNFQTGFTTCPSEKLATIVTSLEMLAKPEQHRLVDKTRLDAYLLQKPGR